MDSEQRASRVGHSLKFAPTPALRERMIQVARQTASPSAVAECAGVGLTTLNVFCSNEPVFAERIREAIAAAIDAAEVEVYKRAMGPGDEGFFDANGNPIDVYNAHGVKLTPLSVQSNDMLKFFLKHRKPGRYNRPDHSLTINLGGLTPEKIKSLSDDELYNLIAQPPTVARLDDVDDS